MYRVGGDEMKEVGSETFLPGFLRRVMSYATCGWKGAWKAH